MGWPVQLSDERIVSARLNRHQGLIKQGSFCHHTRGIQNEGCARFATGFGGTVNQLALFRLDAQVECCACRDNAPG